MVYSILRDFRLRHPEGGQPLSPDQLRTVLLNRQFLDREDEGYSDPFHGPLRPEEYED